MKKLVMRKCVATNNQFLKSELLRVVKNKDNEVMLDLTGKANGKGAYIQNNIEALEIAIKKKSISRALGIEISEEIYEEIRNHITGSKGS